MNARITIGNATILRLLMGANVNITGQNGLTPYIGSNGNWWIGITDTGFKVVGNDGLTPYIKNGNWWIGEIDTGVAADAQPWTPIFSLAIDGSRYVQKLTSYVGGSGAAPTANIGQYLKSDGTFTSVITEAATYTNAEALSSKVDKGGSDKTLKQVEDEIVQLAGDLSQVFVPSVFENIIADENGWVNDYTFNPYALEKDIEPYGVTVFLVDSSGWVENVINNDTEQQLETKDVFVKDQFSDAIVVKSEAKFLGFPGICADNTGVLHAFWRKGSGHVSGDGSIMYSRSIDNGNTWIDETIALQGGILDVDGYAGDWRDSRAILTKDGKILHLTFKSWTNDGGVTYDKSKTQLIATLFPILNGNIDILNKTEVIISNQITGKGLASAGTLFYHNNILYAVAYAPLEFPNENNLIRSLDNGLNWEFVGRIGTYNNECAVGAIGDRFVAVSRNVAGALSDFFISDDFGATWTHQKNLGVLWHGMDAKGLGDYVLVAGRHRIDGTNHGYSFVLYDKFGNEVFPKFDIHNFGGNGDCAYGQICSFQRWIYFIYYNAAATSTVYFKKILRSEILGLNY